MAAQQFHFLLRQVADNALMQLAGIVGIWLTYPLVLIAVFSQFSAAVADAISGSGSLIEVSRRTLSKRTTYLLICSFAIALCSASSASQSRKSSETKRSFA
ncbi:hypothetical protein [Sphingomonas paeninsulae]|uniref:hypothetical protein n=1 Tax=Sphingomonas paeninsulae TaxID=2319844 RepID=UPI001EF10272|nr:hypothetical protein [Sphingomonas paeninsulae]